MRLKETTLYNDWNEPEAISANLEDVKDFILSLFPSLKVSVHFEDYDDYGCEHYVIITGTTATIRLQKNYGGMYIPTNTLVCEVVPNTYRNADSGISHEFNFKEGKAPKSEEIGSDYSERIKRFIENNKHYLNGDSSSFTRKDYHWHNDQSGKHKLANSSYDIVYVADRDFYTDRDIKTSIKSCKEDIVNGEQDWF